MKLNEKINEILNDNQVIINKIKQLYLFNQRIKLIKFHDIDLITLPAPTPSKNKQ